MKTNPLMNDYILNWFEVPVRDLSKAKMFYGTILGIEMQTESVNGIQMAYFPFFNGKPTGCLTEDKSLTPSQDGCLLYLNAGEDLSPALGKVEKAGGKIVIPKTPVAPEYGYYAIFTDPEGNKMGLQSPK